jgi:hypothetical protein
VSPPVRRLLGLGGRIVLATLGSALVSPHARASSSLPSPESALGFPIGEERRLAAWSEIVAYFERLAKASPRVRVETLGKTTEGRPFLLVTLSSARNVASLPRLLEANAVLADPRGKTAEDLRRALSRGRTIVSVNCGIHSVEVGTTEACLAIADRLARGEDPETKAILEGTIVAMIPSQNPDGTDKVAEWYRKTLGGPYEGGRIPFLFHPFTGHDDNRDWYMFTQAETRLTVEGMYHRFHPQIVNDLHQMGAKGARLFVPPYLDPYEPNVDPALRKATDRLGLAVYARLAQEGRTGVVNHAIYDAFSPSRAYPLTHGGVRILFEAASAALATPLSVPFAELEPGSGYDPRRASENFETPWPGGRWTVKDVVEYEVAANLALLADAARNRAEWLSTFLDVNRRAVARDAPAGFVVPGDQGDALAVHELLRVLRMGGVEILRAGRAFLSGGRTFPAGSDYIPLGQPAGAFAKTLLERQHYPDPGPGAAEPYDATAHTLPLLLGVEVAPVEAAPEVDLAAVDTPSIPVGDLPRDAAWISLPHTTAGFLAVREALRRGLPAAWATEPFVDRGRRFESGTLAVALGTDRGYLRDLEERLGIRGASLDTPPAGLALKAPRVGLYQSYVPAMDEGWTRFVLARELDLDATTLHDAEVRAGDLRSLDAIVLPDESPREIVEGNPPGTLPAEYVGGLGAAGVTALRSFVEAGGTLIAFNRASLVPLQHFALPARDVSREGAPGDFACPGSLLASETPSGSPLVDGLRQGAALWFESGPFFEAPAEYVRLRYAAHDVLLSGMMRGEDRVASRAALLEIPLGRGRVILFGFRPQYRAQSWGTYVLLLNALYLASSAPR